MREFVRSLTVFIVMSLITGLAYPLTMAGLSQLAFREKAEGTLVRVDGRVAGSALIGQQFTSSRYFHPRPSALEKPYDAGNSGGSNFGQSNRKFLEEVAGRIDKFREENNAEAATSVPADMALASGSGLDPDISLEAAMMQIKRVAQARGLPEEAVRGIVQGLVEEPFLGLIGQRRVNVLRLNLALDGLRVGN